MFDVKISEEGLLELDAVTDFYSDISIELGERFLQNFDECLLELEQFPFFQIRYDEIRIRQVKNFPILLHYILYELTRTVVIFGVRFPENFPNNQ